MNDLFSYPHRAGHKVGGASQAAADKITDSGRKDSLEQRVLALFERRDDWTPDEAAEAMSKHPADIRPRFSELRLPRVDKNGLIMRGPAIEKTSEIRTSSRGNPQHVYRRLARPPSN